MTVVLTTVLLSLTLASSAWAAQYKLIHKFKGGADGAHPTAGLIFDAAGNLYGTTAYTGANYNGNGTVFKLAPKPDGTWRISELHRFHRADGRRPYAGLVFDAAGNLYGTTAGGGAYDRGTVFKLAPNPDGSWVESVLYSFSGSGPFSRVIFDAAGNLYGTIYQGGADHNGTVFKLSPNPDGTWTESVLYDFTGGADGSQPLASLIFDAGGNLYGTTWGGADSNGTVFKLTPNPDGSWTESVLHSFAGGGANPEASLIFDAVGNLYGTTSGGGAYGLGTVFRLTPDQDGSWTEQVLVSFGGRPACFPEAEVISDAAGNLYGTTHGTCGRDGTVFKLTPEPDGSWKMSNLHTFKGKDGSNPEAGLIMDAAGNLYGTTERGGKGYGVVFEITP
jgi:uncharacterized repeat protein (TIGR03803 family)